MSHNSVLIDVLKIDLCRGDFQQRESVNAAIVGIVWLRSIVHPFDGHLRLVSRRVIRETSIAEASRFNSHVFFVDYTEMFVPPNPAVNLFGTNEWLHATLKLLRVS